MNARLQHIDRTACNALAAELALTPKPGLVTPHTTGSHDDMDHRHFAASISALHGYFADCARLGALGADFNALRTRGLLAEQAMLRATGGVNTHKGAIFTLGLLAAAAGCQPRSALGHTVVQAWGAALSTHVPCNTHGAHVRRSLGLPGAREQAAAGFPVLFDTTLPALRHARERLGDTPHARLHALIATIAVLPDTNLAHRGGSEGLAWAQNRAADFLARGSVLTANAQQDLDAMCTAFEHHRLSPGGSADLLAAALFVAELPHQHTTAPHAEVLPA